jgi:Zn ribbon nucleic-acid-binding protein
MPETASLKCPHCGAKQKIEVPERSCLPFHECAKCGKLIAAPKGECCVICAYADKMCPASSTKSDA